MLTPTFDGNTTVTSITVMHDKALTIVNHMFIITENFIIQESSKKYLLFN